VVALQCNSSWRGDDDLGQLENTAGGLATRKVMVAMTIKGPATIVVAFVLLLFPVTLAEVLLAKDETLLTLSPSVDVIAFSNYTTNNPLDNLKDFPDTWHDQHEFSLSQNEAEGHNDQLAVESREGGRQGVQVSTTASFSEAVQVVRVTLPAHAPTIPPAYNNNNNNNNNNNIPPAYSSLYHETGDQWHDHDHEEVEAVEEHSKNFNTNLYDVVTDDNEGDNLAEEEAQEDVVVEDEDAAYENRLEELQRKYGSKMSAVDSEDFRFSATHEHPHNYPHNKGRMEDPLIMLMKIEPHALDLLVRPRVFVPGTMVRLMYERVPRNRPPLLQHLDDPVIEYVPLHWPAQHHRLQDLPMGKYIVCGEAHKEGHVVQANCFETIIDRLDNNMLPGGVVGVICVAIISIFLVIVYAIYYRVTRESRRSEKEGHPEMGPN